MSEFDFEELDKAVGEALGTASNDRSATAGRPGSDDSSSRLGTSAPRDISQDRPSPSPAARRAASGRFMDVMHPSSDMRNASNGARPLSDITRTASVDSGAVADSEPVVDESPAVAPAVEEPELPFIDEPLNSEEEVSEVAVEEDEPSVPESPFIADAVVEKRPLGYVPPETKTSDPEFTGEDMEAIKLEAEDSVYMSEPSLDFEVPAEAATTDLSAVEVDKIVADEPAPASIFDTPATSVTVGKKSGKKSPLVVILWILALIVLGAGAGFAVFTYVLPLI